MTDQLTPAAVEPELPPAAVDILATLLEKQWAREHPAPATDYVGPTLDSATMHSYDAPQDGTTETAA